MERGYRSTLLAAAYRHHLHWSQLIGRGVILSMPYAWWKQFEASDIEVADTLDRPVEPRIVDGLYTKFADFRRAYDEGGLAPEEFVRYGATVHTLNQFICRLPRPPGLRARADAALAFPVPSFLRRG